MIQSLINDLTEPIKDKAIINIIYCDNNLLLTQQTCKRVDNDLKDLVKVGEEIYLEFSSHKRTEYRKKADVGWAILSKEIKNILCCTNSKRMDDIYDLINELIKIKPNELHFKIWLDEADKFTNFIDTTLKPLVDKFENIDVYCITATPKKLFIKYKIMNVLPIENTTTENYHGWEDNNIILPYYIWDNRH